MGDDKGYITIMILWITAILVALSSGLIIYVKFQQRALKNYVKSIKAFYIAKAGLNDIMFTIHSSKKELKDEETGIKELNNSYQNVAFGEGTYSVILEDEKSKANINTASVVLLRNIMNNIGIDDSSRKAESIINWRMEHGVFINVEELGLVSDLDVNDCFKLVPYFTIYSIGTPGSCSLNVNTASREVLKAHFDEFNAPASITDDIIKRRPFKGEEVWTYIKKKAPNLSDSIVKYFTYSAPVHRVRVISRLDNIYVSDISVVFEGWLRGHEIISIHYWWQE